MKIVFAREVKMTDLIEKWTSLSKEIREINSTEQSDFEKGIKKTLNIGKYFRIATALPRLYYFTDRLRDLNFVMNILSENLLLENSEVKKEFVNDYLSLTIPNNIITIWKSLLNFLCYYYDLDSKDENLNINEVLNYLSIADNAIANSLEHTLSSEYLESIERSLTSINNGYIGMGKLKSNRNGKRRDIKIDMDNNNYTQVLTDLVNLTLSKLNSFTNAFENSFMQDKAVTGGYVSPNDIFTKIDDKTSSLKGVLTKELTQKSSIMYIKLLNLSGDLPPKVEYPGFGIYRNIDYNRVEERMYRPSKRVSRTVNLTDKRPAKVSVKESPVSEGEMVWTHTVKVNTQKVKDTKTFEEDLCLILSLFNKNAVFSPKSQVHYSHKAIAHAFLQTPTDYTESLGKALSNLHKKRGDNQLLIRGLLRDYKEVKQPQSFTSEYIKLWNIIDKLGNHYISTKNIHYNNVDKKTLQEVRSLINLNANLKKLNIIDSLDYAYSLSKQRKDLFKKKLKIDKILGTDFSGIWKVLQTAYAFRSNLMHKPNIHLKGDLIAKVLPYYLFLYNLVFLVLLKLLNIQPSYTYKRLVEEMVGFINDPDYYEKLRLKHRETNKQFQNMIDILSGKKPPQPGGIHVRL